MALVVNSNLTVTQVLRSLSAVRGVFDIAMQRLSSGLRINSARDDASGLAIVGRHTSQIRGFTVAARNVNDGMSMMQTSDAAMGQMSESLQRMRELAIQAMNGANSSSDRARINTEYQQLSVEIDRVAKTTSFNGSKLIDGSITALNFQVGANGGENISITDIASLRTSALGTGTFGGDQSGTAVSSPTGITGAGQFTFEINGVTYDVFKGNSIGGNAQALANAVNAAAVPGVSATAARTSVTGNFVGGGVAAGTATVTINGKNINVALTGTGASDVLSTINAIRANSGSTGVTADAAGSGIRLTAQDGRNIDLAFSGGATGATADSVGLGDGGGSVVAATTFGTYSLNYQGGKGLPTLTIGGSAGADVKGQADNLITPVRMGTRLDQTNLLDFDGAKAAVVAIDDALNTIREERSNLGAYLNRFGFAAEHILNEIENLSASRSRIQDADYASEISQLLRGQVLQQAGNAMLVQANAQPRLVLALLM